MKFTELDLKPSILQALDAMGYTDLTPIQEQTFKPVMEDRDLVGIAETGSGKTSACAIPLVQRIEKEENTDPEKIITPGIFVNKVTVVGDPIIESIAIDNGETYP